MIVRGESTIIDYHAPFDQGFRAWLKWHINLAIISVQVELKAMFSNYVTKGGCIYNTDPCGTPHCNSTEDDLVFSTWINCLRSLRCDANQCRALPLMPYRVFSRLNKMTWSTVSKAADKSSNKRKHFPVYRLH